MKYDLRSYTEVFVGGTRYFVCEFPDRVTPPGCRHSVLREVIRRGTCGVIQRVAQPAIREAAIQAFQRHRAMGRA